MKITVLLVCACLPFVGVTQAIADELSSAIRRLEGDEQFKHAILAMYVVDGQTGKLVYEKNSQVGLAAASCQKVVTSAAAFEFLGQGFVYKTAFSYNGEIEDGVLNGSLYLRGAGDPTLGSWRWKTTKEEAVLNALKHALAVKAIRKITGNIYIINENWDTNIIPDGWTWEDMGNYYGAGATALNWRENQYDIVLNAGNIAGEKVILVKTEPKPTGVWLVNELKTAKQGSGDNAYVYLPPYAAKGFIRGTIPAGEKNFVISGSFPDPEQQAISVIRTAFQKDLILPMAEAGKIAGKPVLPSGPLTTIEVLQSPTLDSMNYWFLKKSINLYGEAFVKTIAYEKKNYGSSDTGIALIRDFWSKRGIEKSSLKIIDGSGLSPANRVTAQALVTVMQYAKNQPWYSSFYFALPEMNGIKMKDGYIGGVRSYTGYVRNSSGKEYTFCFIVNNFDGSPGTVREKMWKILDLLK